LGGQGRGVVSRRAVAIVVGVVVAHRAVAIIVDFVARRAVAIIVVFVARRSVAIDVVDVVARRHRRRRRIPWVTRGIITLVYCSI
jgi:hypothetical protein